MAQLSQIKDRMWNMSGLAVLRAMLWLLLGAVGVMFASRAFGWVSSLMWYAYPADGLEGPLLTQAHLLWNGQQLYQPFELYRFVSAPYPPWHPLALGFADQFAAPHPFWSGRIVSLLSAVGVVMVAALITWRVSRSLLASFLAAALLFSFPPLALWATRIKPDMYALLWTALGLLFATLALAERTKNRKIRRTKNKEQRISEFRLGSLFSVLCSSFFVLCSSLCFALAFFTKQTALAAPLAAGLAFLLADLRAWRGDAQAGYRGRFPLRFRTILFGASYLGVIGLAWLLLDRWSAGQFTFHIWTQHRNALWTPQLLFKFVSLLGYTWPLMLLGLATLALAWRAPRAQIVACYLLIVPATLYGAGKTGANHNHLLETLLALAMAGGIMIGWAMRNLALRPVLASAVVGLFGLQMALAFSPPEWYGGELVRTGTPQRYIDFIKTVPGEVLADDPSLLYLADKPLRYDDPSGFGPVAHSGLWDQTGMIDDITQRRFGAIIIPIDVEAERIDPSGRWTPEMLAAIRTNYQVLYRDTEIIYIPK
ncbi:MAG: hypothetical protein H7Z42_19855 [Roseiflexaceae bacterium]|nr:hypothetical protein [Roseiflexaceae bacterium]